MDPLDTDSVLHEVVEALNDDGSHYLEMMAAAYWQHTQIAPEHSALVQRTRGEVTVYYFVTHTEADRLMGNG